VLSHERFLYPEVKGYRMVVRGRGPSYLDESEFAISPHTTLITIMGVQVLARWGIKADFDPLDYALQQPTAYLNLGNQPIQ
jgi:hypothetical protein